MNSPLLCGPLLLVLALFMVPGAAAADAWEFASPEPIVADLNVPVDLAFGRDGYVYIALLTDRAIVRAAVDTGTIDKEFRVEFPDADWQIYTETGLFSLALHPEFHENGVLYASYSRNESGEWQNVLSRVTLRTERGDADEEILLTRPGGHWHNGGRVMVADGHLWWTTGDATPYYEWKELARVAQEDGNLVGKVLRLTLDGEPAPDNPWDDHAYTKGHRNVFGIAWDPTEGRALVTENGNALADYIYILEAGANYGWPDCEGPCSEPQEEFTDPVWHSEGTIAPTGAAWFRGAFWWGTFNQGDIYRASDATGEWQIENVYHHAAERPRVLAMAAGPDGESLWYSTYEDAWRIPFPPHEDHPAQDGLAGGPYWWENAGPRGGDTTGTIPTVPVLGLVAAAVAVALGAARRRD